MSVLKESRRRFLATALSVVVLPSCSIEKTIRHFAEWTIDKYLKDPRLISEYAGYMKKKGYKYIGERVVRLFTFLMLFRQKDGTEEFDSLLSDKDWRLSTPDELVEYAMLTLSTIKFLIADDLIIGDDDDLINKYSWVQKHEDSWVAYSQDQSHYPWFNYHYPVLAYSRNDMPYFLDELCRKLADMVEAQTARLSDTEATYLDNQKAVISALFPDWNCRG